MARIAVVMELQPIDRRKPQDAGCDQGRDTSPDGDVLMGQILENLHATPQEEVLKRIASLPPNRQGKVLDIRRQIAAGTYEMAARLNAVTDRVLEAMTA